MNRPMQAKLKVLILLFDSIGFRHS